MKLLTPTAEYKESFLEAVGEYRSDFSHKPCNARYVALDLNALANDFGSYVRREIERAEGKNLPVGFVPDSIFWLIDNDEFIGSVRIRHTLTPHLLNAGGHIGYDIRPSMRNRGFGSKILELAIPKAHELGIDRILLTCDENNVASRKIIEKNGGVLENEYHDDTGIGKLRFWIS